MSTNLKITNGFDFEEAIFLVNCSKQAYDIFQYDDGTIDDSELKDVYNSLNRNLGWKFVHTIRNDQTNVRGIILKQNIGHQYVIAFRGSILTDRGYTELTDIAADTNWTLVDYGTTINERIKVAQGFYVAFQSVTIPIRFFFKVLLGQLTLKDFLTLKSLPLDQQFACVTAMFNAGGIRLGAEFEEKTKEYIKTIVADEQLGDEEIDKILEDIKSDLLDITPLDESVDVYVTGHSLGGSLAFLSSLALKEQFNTPVSPVSPDSFVSPVSPSIKVKVYTYGGTKVGNKEFANYYNQKIGAGLCYRVENRLDSVHENPPNPPFPLNILAGNGFRMGNYVLGDFVHVGDSYSVLGLGSQQVSLSFGSPLEFIGGIPFPHSYDTYRMLLEEERQRWSQLFDPIKTVLRPFIHDLLQEELAKLVISLQAVNKNTQSAVKDSQPESKQKSNTQSAVKDSQEESKQKPKSA
jgi:hypothetical protein